MTSCRRHGEHAFTLAEAIVCLCILFVFLALALPAFTGCCCASKMTQSLSNMKQLHLATTQLAIDGETTGNTNLNWPGDTGATFTAWSAQLVPSCFTTNEFCKLLSAPGKIVRRGQMPATMNESAILIYAASKNSPSDTVFLTSANFTNTPSGGDPLNPKTKPYGNEGFVIFRKAGDGAILLPRQTGQTNIIGSYVPLLK